MDNAPRIEIKSNRHFQMLAALVIGIGILQTAYLDSRRVSHADMQNYLDTTVALTTAATSYEAAKSRQLLKTEIEALDVAIMERVLVPLTSIEKSLQGLDSTYKRGQSQNEALINYQMLRIRQILESPDSSLYYRIYPRRF